MDSKRLEQQGLTAEEVRQRQAAGQVNIQPAAHSKTIAQIITGNVFTYFNLINLIIFLLILTTGRIANTLFMGVIVSNILIGIIQEIRAKKVIDNLSILTDVTATVIRDGQEQKIAPDQLVLDDQVVLLPGSQVSADAQVVLSQELEMDESLLTGESEPVHKLPGDQVLSGSFVVSGSGQAQVIHVGQDNYAQQITAEARRYKRARSEILQVINRVIKVISLIIIPVGLLSFLNQYLRLQVSWQDAVVSTSAGMIGMIPEGLVLLTSVTLAVGIIRLARRRAMVQELAGIEVLARTNVLCLDKTGTLTQGTLEVTELIPLDSGDGQAMSPDELGRATAALVAAFRERNSTAAALAGYFGPAPDWPVLSRIPFSSARKWSSVSFAGQGTWFLGSVDFILGDRCPAVTRQVEQLAEQGNRVVLIAQSLQETGIEQPGPDVLPRALILMADVIRPEARSTLDFFAENDVTVKLISGDHPAAVASVARRLAVRGADQIVDASRLSDDPQAVADAVRQYTVFGHVTPRMKKLLIAALKQQGNIVAMTGDGVNDVQALREADCSIVMASGSDAAKNIAHIVLLDSDFMVMPDVVREGRQVIGNIERVASLFLVKTTYASLLSVIFILLGLAYPFDPIHQTLLGGFGIGIPAFFLALEQNHKRIQPGFLGRVVRTAVPGGLAITLMILVIKILQGQLAISDDQTRLISVMVAGLVTLAILLRVCLPLNWKRGLLLVGMAVLFFAESIIFAELLNLPAPQSQSAWIIAGLGVLAYPLLMVLRLLTGLFLKDKG